MNDDENVTPSGADEPQIIPDKEPLPPPEEQETKKAREPDDEEEDKAEVESEEGDGDEPDPDEDDKPKRKRPGKYQRTVSRLEARLEQQDRMIRELVGRAGGGQQPSQEAPKPPRQEDFTDYGEFLEAKAEWKAGETVRQLLHQERQRFQQTQVQSRQEEAREKYTARTESAREKYDDFDDVIEDGRQSVTVTDPMANAIMSADNGPEIEYHLYTHPDEAEKIARMDPVSQVRAIGRLEAKLLTPRPKKTTSAPNPVKPLGGTAGGGVGSNDPTKMDMEAYKKWREAGNG